ncbi:hypothetical protein [Mycoplasma sp. E35C]|uniref:hypothetical protein n=1 Tax=Mycoplasma sp. E35C TaxID=2801918 RepID=UPI001CA3A3AE|nr:hypothetical protein [Mycoplasma sp. E35C]QZX49048.1 hypothetical protein JJE79_03250 [Mycoplasma sp. E35C]
MNKTNPKKIAELKKSLSTKFKKQIIYGTVAFGSVALASGIIAASVSATDASGEKLTSVVQTNSNLVNTINGGVNPNNPSSVANDIFKNSNSFIGDLSASYADRDKGIVDINSGQIKPYDQTKISDAYVGSNGELLTKEQAAESLLPEYKLIKKYTFNNSEALYDSLSELKENYWDSIAENPLAFYAFKDKDNQQHYFNPLNKEDVKKFKEFVITQVINGENQFSLDYYVPYNNESNNSSFVSLAKSSAVFSDQGNLTLNADANLGKNFDQKINQLFSQKVNQIFSQSSFLPTISLPTKAIPVEKRAGIYLDYPKAPEYGFDKYFGIGFKNQEQDWNNVNISNSIKVEQGVNINSLIDNLRKISTPDQISQTFNSVELNSRYERNKNGEIVPSTYSLSPDQSTYGLGLDQEQENLKPLIANYNTTKQYENKSDREVAGILDKEFLKTHAYINNRSFVTKDGADFFGQKIGLIYKGNLYGYTVHGDPSVAENYTKGGSGSDKVFYYHNTFSNDSWWLKAGNFNKENFVKYSPYYFGFGNLENANASYGTYPESVGISNDTIHVGADIFDLSTGRRNASGIVNDIRHLGKRQDAWSWSLTFLPSYWESYRIAPQNRQLYLNVNVDWKYENQLVKNKDEFIKKITSQFGLKEENKQLTIDKDSQFYKDYLSQSYVNGANTYAILAGLNNFSSVNAALDENFLTVAKAQVKKFSDFYDKTTATFSLGNGQDNRFADYLNTFNDLLKANSNLKYNSINISGTNNANFLVQHVFDNKDIKPVITFGNNKQPLFEIDLAADKKNLLVENLKTNQNNFKQALLSLVTQLPKDELQKTLINLSNHYQVEGIDFSTYTYDLKSQRYLALNSQNKVELKTQYQTNSEVRQPLLPRNVDANQYARLITDDRTWYAITYMWKFYEQALSKLSQDKIKQDNLISNPDDILVLEGSINSYYDLRFGKYFNVTGDDVNLAINSSFTSHNLFFDSVLKREATKYYNSQLSSSVNVDDNYEIVLYYNNATNKNVGLVRGNHKNLKELEQRSRMRALVELNPPTDNNYKFYIEGEDKVTKVKNITFTLYPAKLPNGKVIYFDSQEHLKNYLKR